MEATSCGAVRGRLPTSGRGGLSGNPAIQQSGRGDILGAEYDAVTVPLASSIRNLSSKPFVAFFERTMEMERIRLRFHADA
jgi:hypothetical protein